MWLRENKILLEYLEKERIWGNQTLTVVTYIKV